MNPVRIDGHLDLAYDAIAIGRDPALERDDLRASEGRTRKTAMDTRPEPRRAGVMGGPWLALLRRTLPAA
jgi:hypothetical protein